MSLTRSESRKIAARYVSALFDLALADKAQEKVGEDLLALKAVIAENADLQKMMRNPMIPVSEKKAVFEALLKKLGAHQRAVESVAFLIENKRVEIIADVADLYHERLIAYKGELSAEVTSAKELSAAQIKSIQAALKKAAGRDIDIHVKQDESIIGGLIIRVGSRMLDRSVAGKLQRLKATLSA